VVLVIQDASEADARDVVTPGVLGLELGLQGSGLGIRIVEADDLDPAEQVSDDLVVAAVIAPFTHVPGGSESELREGGIPVISLSELTGGGAGHAPLRAFVSPLAQQADAAGALITCVAGDGSTWSEAFIDHLPPMPVFRGGPAAVAVGVADEGCRGVAWTGGATAGAALAGFLARTSPNTMYVVTSRARTGGFAETVDVALAPRGLCPCVDLTTSVDPVAQRFVHAYQSANGLDAGPFAVEGFDAGRLLVAAGGAQPRRVSIAEGLAETSRYGGLGGPYAWDDQGGLVDPSVRMYERVGLRWVELSSTRFAA